PSRCATEQRDELAPLHSITSSARARSVGGTVRPSILAVSAFMTNSNLVGSVTGRSAGLAPLRMRRTYVPAWGLRKPITGIAGCCARAASGHATAAPPTSVMNWRLLPRNSIRKRFGINDLPVSSILVRSGHGNSFDHLVGKCEQRVRY